MWPERGDALSRTIEAEQAIEGLYAEALRRWAPAARASVLPTLAAKLIAAGSSFNGDPTAATLPPDPDAVQQTSPQWDELAAELIIAGTAVLWAATLFEVLGALGLPIPSLPDGAPAYRQPARKVLQIVDAAVGDMDRAQVIEAARIVDATPALSEQRDAFLATQRVEAEKTPGRVQAKIEMAIRAAPIEGNTPAESLAVQRDAARDAIDPAGEEMREIARTAGHQAAAVQNHAVLTAALGSEDADDLEKVWIATLDGKTRPTHFAADGQRTPITGTFTVGGEALQYPADPSGTPAETANCRCRMGILEEGDALPDEVDRHTERLDGRDSVAIRREGRTQAEEIQRRADEGTIRAREDPDGIGRTAAGGWTAPSEQEYEMKRDTKVEMAAEEGDDETFLTFTDALFAVTGIPTSDGRMLASDIKLEFRDTPMPLQWCEKMEGGHYGSVTVGVIESIALKSGQVLGSGFMLNSENALKAIEVISHGVANPSIDLGDYDMIATDENGKVVTEENYEDGMDVYATVTSAEVMATTIVAIPAFGETRIALNETRESRTPALVAAAAAKFEPRVYDPAVFSDPGLSGPTRLTITEDGHIFGHVACFGACHRSIQSECIMAPRSRTGYSHFHTSPDVRLSDGNTLAVGRLTVGTGHAPENLAAGPAVAHYDNTGTCFALVRAGEDAHGIWVSGVAAPWATTEQIEEGLSSPLSGDWRLLDGSLELVAALSVNTPGFVLASGKFDANGTQMSLVASLAPSPDAEAGGIGHLSLDDIRAAVREGIAEERRHAALAAERDAAMALAREAVGEPPAPKSPRDEIADILAEVNV